MKEKGFTLIELLAVIVILAIIALIATPIVLNVIQDSKDSSRLNSANYYLDAVSNAIIKYNMNNGGSFIPKECKVQSDGNLKCDGKDITVEVDGEVPISGIIKFNSDKIDDVFLNYGEKYIIDDESGILIYGEPLKIKTYYENGEPVFYNVDTGKLCLENEAVSTSGTKSGCMRFYAFNDKEGNDTLNLILDHNTTATVSWTSVALGTSSNANGAIDLLTALYNDTKNWVGTVTPEDYTMDQSIQPNGSNYTVEYSKTPNIEGATGPYRARLITAQEIAQITGKENWDETLSTSGFYYFHDLSSNWQTGEGSVCASQGCTYGWLYDGNSTNCTNYGCLNNSDVQTYGYWIVSSRTVSSNYACGVGYVGGAGISLYFDGNPGVRPVITLLKSKHS